MLTPVFNFSSNLLTFVLPDARRVRKGSNSGNRSKKRRLYSAADEKLPRLRQKLISGCRLVLDKAKLTPQVRLIMQTKNSRKHF